MRNKNKTKTLNDEKGKITIQSFFPGLSIEQKHETIMVLPN